MDESQELEALANLIVEEIREIIKKAEIIVIFIEGCGFVVFDRTRSKKYKDLVERLTDSFKY